MSHFLIGWVRLPPDTLRYSQLRIAKKKAMCVSIWNLRRNGSRVGIDISFLKILNGIAFCGCSAGSLFL
jgi:hypothetical protein